MRSKSHLVKRCQHNRERFWCCECNYGKQIDRDRLDKPKDLVEEMNRLRGGTESLNPTDEDNYDK